MARQRPNDLATKQGRTCFDQIENTGDGQMSTVDTKVEIEGEKFDVCAIPGENTESVKRAKGNVLKNLDLEKLVANLERSASLLFLAYNGVAGFGELRAATNKLQDDLGVLCRDAELALDRFRTKTGSILSSLKDTFTWLTKGKEKLALGYLSNVAKTATEMATEAESLAKRFDELADKTREACSATEIQQGKTDKEREELANKLSTLRGANEAAKAELKVLADLQKRMQELYDEAKAKAETAESRAFGLAITNAIMQPLAQGIGAFAGAFTRTQTGLPLPPTLPSTTESTKPKKEEEEGKEKAQKELREAQAEAGNANGALTKAQNEETGARRSVNEKAAAVKVAEEASTEAKSKRDIAKQPTANEKEDLDKAVTKAEGELRTARSELEKAKGVLQEKETARKMAEDLVAKKQKEVEIARAAVTAAAQALDAAASAVGQAADSYMTLAQKYEETRRDYLNKWLSYKEKEAQKLGEIEKYAVEMSTVKSSAEIEKTISESLIQAVKAFNEVSQILRTAAQFWRQMAEACKAVGPDSKLQSDLKLYVENLSAEDRMAVYTETEFKTRVVEYMASWKALELICGEYSRAAAQTRVKVQENIRKSPSPEESIQLTSVLARGLIENAKRASNSVQADMAAIRQAASPAAAARN